MDNKYIDPWYGAGFELVALHKNGKRPVSKDWTNSPLTIEEARAHDGNLGWLIPDNVLVFDVDTKNAGDQSFLNLQEDLGIKIPINCVTPTKGTHTYYAWEGKAPFKMKQYPGIDLLRKGRQVLIPGCTIDGVLYNTHMTSPQLYAMPDELRAVITSTQPTTTSTDEDEKLRGILSPDDLRTALSKMAAEEYREYSKWFSLMAACHHSTDAEGMVEFIDWSTKDAQHSSAASDIEMMWEKLGQYEGEQYTVRTLLHLMKSDGLDDRWIRARLNPSNFEVIESGDTEQQYMKKIDKLDSVYDAEKLLSDIATDPDVSGLLLDFLTSEMCKKMRMSKGEVKKVINSSLGLGDEEKPSYMMAAGIALRSLIIDDVPAIYTENRFWVWAGTHWVKREVHEIDTLVVQTLNQLKLQDSSSALRSLREHMQVMCAANTPEKPDAKKMRHVFNFVNGTLKVESDGSSKLHAHNPKHLLKFCIPFNWEPERQLKLEAWKQYCSTSLVGDEEDSVKVKATQLAVMIAYAASEGDLWLQKAFILYGAARSGKSVLLKVLSELFEGHTSFASLGDLSGRFGKTLMAHSKVNITHEVDQGIQSTRIFKQIVSGDDMQIEEKGMPAYMIRPATRLIMSTNHLPAHSDTSEGIFRRAVIIPYEHMIDEKDVDFRLQDKLEAEIADIVHWSVRIYAANLKDDLQQCLRPLLQIQQDTQKEWRQLTDPVLIYLEDHMKASNDIPIEECAISSDVFNSYRIWCDKNNLRPESQIAMGRRAIQWAKAHGVDSKSKAIKRDGSVTRRWTGIKFCDLSHISE